MVSTSNWPPLVAMSVVTRWRSTFSSSVTHLTAMSGFLAVKSLVSACMRIMSPLLTVAMVRVVCAVEGAAPNKIAAPRRALRTCFTVTSLRAEHMLTPCNYVHTELRVVKDRIALPHRTRRREDVVRWGRMPGMAGGRPARAESERPAQSLRLEDRACRRLVGDQPVDQPPLQRRPDGRNLGTTDRRPDRRASAGTRGGMLVRRRLVPPLIRRPSSS